MPEPKGSERIKAMESMLSDLDRSKLVKEVIAFQDRYNLDRDAAIHAILNSNDWDITEGYEDIVDELAAATFDAIGD